MAIKRFLQLLTLLGLLLAPAGMFGRTVAMASPQAAATAAPASHCAEMGEEHGSDDAAPASDIDCMIACSGIPATSGGVVERLHLAALLGPAAVPAPSRGLHPQAEPPPPRLA